MLTWVQGSSASVLAGGAPAGFKALSRSISNQVTTSASTFEGVSKT